LPKIEIRLLLASGSELKMRRRGGRPVQHSAERIQGADCEAGKASGHVISGREAFYTKNPPFPAGAVLKRFRNIQRRFLNAGRFGFN
jgi:hypothetical protein